jgi:hypothetical protein
VCNNFCSLGHERVFHCRAVRCVSWLKQVWISCTHFGLILTINSHKVYYTRVVSFILERSGVWATIYFSWWMSPGHTTCHYQNLLTMVAFTGFHYEKRLVSTMVRNLRNIGCLPLTGSSITEGSSINELAYVQTIRWRRLRISQVYNRMCRLCTQTRLLDISVRWMIGYKRRCTCRHAYVLCMFVCDMQVFNTGVTCVHPAQEDCDPHRYQTLCPSSTTINLLFSTCCSS